MYLLSLALFLWCSHFDFLHNQTKLRILNAEEYFFKPVKFMFSKKATKKNL